LLSPFTLINIFKFLNSVFISLFPVAIASSITLAGIVLYSGVVVFVLLNLFKFLKKKSSFNENIINSLDFAFIVYIVLFTLTKIVNSGIDEGLNTFLRSCQDYFVFLWVKLFIIDDEKNEERIFKCLFLAASISVVYGTMQFFHMDIFHRQSDINRLSGFHKNSYTYGGQLIIQFFFLLNHFIKTRKFPTLILFALAFFCILNTSERAVLFGIIIGLLFYFVLSKLQKKQMVYLSPIIVIPLLFTAFFNKKVINRIKNIFSSGAKKNVRLKIWGIAVSMWKKNILFGVGKFPEVYHQIPGKSSYKVLTHAHNVYLQILVTNGLMGLFAYLTLIFAILNDMFSNLKTNKYACALVAVVFAFMAEGCFEFFWGDSEVRYLFLYFAGFVSGMSIRDKIQGKV